MERLRAQWANASIARGTSASTRPTPRALGDKGKERDLFEEVRACRQPYVDSRTLSKKLLADGKREEAIAAVDSHVIPALTKYVKAWDAFAAFEEARQDLRWPHRPLDHLE